MPSRTLAQGLEALRQAQRLLPLMSPVVQGGFNIPVGTLDRQQRMLILGASSGEVYYIHGDKLQALGTAQFLQGYFIGQVASEVYRRTAWIIPASRITMAFCMGMVIGYAGAVAVAANILVTVARVAALAGSHPNEVEALRRHLPAAVRSLSWLRTNCPVLYGKLSSVVQRGALEALRSAPSGITAEDVAAVVGRILGGVSGATDTGLRVLLGIVTRTVAVYSAIHLPGAAARGAAANAARVGDAVVQELRQQQVSVTPEEAEQITQELGRSAQALTELEGLRAALEGAAPALDRLLAAFARGA